MTTTPAKPDLSNDILLLLHVFEDAMRLRDRMLRGQTGPISEYSRTALKLARLHLRRLLNESEDSRG